MSLKPLTPRSSDGKMLVATDKPTGSRLNFFSHRWNDKTTWYSSAVRVVDEVPTTNDNITYTLSHQFVIDTYHGKLWQEHTLKDGSNNSYRVVVKVDDVTKTERDPHVGSGGDYVVDYRNGTITFASTQTGEVKVTYHYATNSKFTVVPAAGKRLVVDVAEANFSTDSQLTDSIVFRPYGYIDVFAPQLLQSNGGPYPSGTQIPLYDVMYKTFYDMIAEANKVYPAYPDMNSSHWRGMKPVTVFDWDYVRSTEITSAIGPQLPSKIEILLEHDIELVGSFAQVTFYCEVEGI